MGYVKVKGVGKVYVLEPGDKVQRSGCVERPDGTTVAGTCADAQRHEQWKADGLLELPKKKKAAAKKTGAVKE